MMESLVPEYDKTGYVRERSGAIIPNVAPSNVYPTIDGQLVLIAANQDAVFARLAAAIGQARLSLDSRFTTHVARGEHQVELDDIVAKWTVTKTREEVLAAMQEAGVPAGLIYRAPEMLEDPHFRARQSIVSVPHPDFGEIRMQNVAPRLSLTPGNIRSPSPAMGQHNEAIYLDLIGMSRARFEQLRGASVI
jgi:succinyl-CoA---D-citramalate CoA-transferase